VGAISHKNSADVSTMNWVCGAQAFLADGRRVGVRVSTGIRLRQYHQRALSATLSCAGSTRASIKKDFIQSDGLPGQARQ
jgi:hypothetical protein